jgi:hypothetical protein
VGPETGAEVILHVALLLVALFAFTAFVLGVDWAARAIDHEGSRSLVALLRVRWRVEAQMRTLFTRAERSEMRRAAVAAAADERAHQRWQLRAYFRLVSASRVVEVAEVCPPAVPGQATLVAMEDGIVLAVGADGARDANLLVLALAAGTARLWRAEPFGAFGWSLDFTTVLGGVKIATKDLAMVATGSGAPQG